MRRLLPVVLLTAPAMGCVVYVHGAGLLAVLNTLPMLAVIVLAALSLAHGRGRFTGAGWKWPLGTLGFSIPAVGLSLYLHYAWLVDLDGLASEARDPRNLFLWLPAYTVFAGGIGFAIGWIAGRNV